MPNENTLFNKKPAAQSDEEITINVEGAGLYCRVIGEGEPLLVLHGGPGLSMDYLFPQLKALAEDHRVIFYDQRGNGKSSGEVTEATMQVDIFIKDLVAIQKHFKLSQFSLLGHSWGAYLALQYAVLYPKQINKLFILNAIPVKSKFSQAEEQKDPYEEMIAKIKASAEYAKDDKEGLLGLYNKTFKGFFYDEEKINRLDLALSAEQLKKSADIHYLFQTTFFHQPYDLLTQLKQLSGKPTLIIHGAGHDVPLAVADEIQKAIEGSSLEILQCGHFPHLERPDELFSTINAFNAQDLTVQPHAQNCIKTL